MALQKNKQVKNNKLRYVVAAILSYLCTFDYLSPSHVTAHNEECGFSSDWIS